MKKKRKQVDRLIAEKLGECKTKKVVDTKCWLIYILYSLIIDRKDILSSFSKTHKLK